MDLNRICCLRMVNLGCCTCYFIQSTFKASFKLLGKSTQSTQKHHQKPIQYAIRTRYLNTSDKLLCSECIQKFFLRECSDMKWKFETSNARLIRSKLVPSPFKEHILKNLSLAIWTSVIHLKAFVGMNLSYSFWGFHKNL